MSSYHLVDFSVNLPLKFQLPFFFKFSCRLHDTLKMLTKWAHSIFSTPSLKDIKCFWNGLVSKPYKRSLCEWKFISVKLSQRNMLYQLNYLMLTERSINANLIVSFCSFFPTESLSEWKYASRLVKKAKNITN